MTDDRRPWRDCPHSCGDGDGGGDGGGGGDGEAPLFGSTGDDSVAYCFRCDCERRYAKAEAEFTAVQAAVQLEAEERRTARSFAARALASSSGDSSGDSRGEGSTSDARAASEGPSPVAEGRRADSALKTDSNHWLCVHRYLKEVGGVLEDSVDCADELEAESSEGEDAESAAEDAESAATSSDEEGGAEEGGAMQRLVELFQVENESDSGDDEGADADPDYQPP